MSFNLTQIKDALKGICTTSGSTEIAVGKISNAQEMLKEAIEVLNEVPVAGKDTLDCLLGCIMCLELITGESEVNADGE